MKSQIINKQVISDLEITEMVDPNLFDGEPFFKVCLKGRVTGRIYPTFDMALIGGLTLKYDGINTQADKFICRTLGIEGEYFT